MIIRPRFLRVAVAGAMVATAAPGTGPCSSDPAAVAPVDQCQGAATDAATGHRGSDAAAGSCSRPSGGTEEGPRQRDGTSGPEHGPGEKRVLLEGELYRAVVPADSTWVLGRGTGESGLLLVLAKANRELYAAGG